ncbi:MAG: ABC transporter ATP-binding protein [Calditrichaeota bacterium]|nr:ABC transporter ATP-binding protein [Calditrichota bacterium]
MLSIENLVFTAGRRTILNQLNLQIFRGEIHSILGQNGTGKSTLAYVLMGLSGFRPAAGRIYFDGEDITLLPAFERAKRGMTLAWQEPARFEGLTVAEYLEIAKKNGRNHMSIQECLERVGLNPGKYLLRAVDETLSGGERKRIELASILAMQPRLAILDEPDSGIDAPSMDHIIHVIRKVAQMGGAVLLITHHEKVAEIADRSSFLCGGRILRTGDPIEIARFFRLHCEECPHINQPEMEMSENA